jgi:hypothetical protein
VKFVFSVTSGWAGIWSGKRNSGVVLNVVNLLSTHGSDHEELTFSFVQFPRVPLHAKVSHN